MKLVTQACDEWGLPTSSGPTPEAASRPEGAMASAPMMSRASSVSFLWYSDHSSLLRDDSGPWW